MNSIYANSSEETRKKIELEAEKKRLATINVKETAQRNEL